MQVGVSTACLYPMESEKALRLLLDRGIRHFEFFINSYMEMRQPFLSEFKKNLDNSGAKVKSIHPYTSIVESMLFFGNYDRRLEEGLEFYKNFFEAANFLDAEIFVLHGQLMGKDGEFLFSDAEYCERYSRLYDLGKSFGISVCQENVFKNRSRNISFIKTMKNELHSEVAFVFDIKQCIMCGENPVEMIAAMGDGLKHVHLSDNTKTDTCLLPGAGNTDYNKIFKTLKDIEYDGSVIIEVYSNNYKKIEEIEKASIFVQNFFN